MFPCRPCMVLPQTKDRWDSYTFEVVGAAIEAVNEFQQGELPALVKAGWLRLKRISRSLRSRRRRGGWFKKINS